ncbi:hypothetical protein WME89_49670 [Sorangium sp. So ce321]|uniref:hypothetical protein n=1 Tax=Sorangium sp. So ce321 TaxID=3133300 RepID=UPI003F5EFEB4
MAFGALALGLGPGHVKPQAPEPPPGEPSLPRRALRDLRTGEEIASFYAMGQRVIGCTDLCAKHLECVAGS